MASIAEIIFKVKPQNVSHYFSWGSAQQTSRVFFPLDSLKFRININFMKQRTSKTISFPTLELHGKTGYHICNATINDRSWRMTVNQHKLNQVGTPL